MLDPLPRVVLTGGVSGGHTFPLVAVARVLRRRYPNGVELLFVGARGAFEESTMEAEQIPVKTVWYGKMRRYFSLLNYLDYFKMPLGFVQALWYLFWFLPDAVFSKGGAASVPVVLAARLYRIPVLLHDSDAVAGRANIWLAKIAQKVAIAYPSAAQFFPEHKVALTGNPVREEIRSGERERAIARFQTDATKKTLFVVGGSQGARDLNRAVLRALPLLLAKDIQVIHQTGTAHLADVAMLAAEIGIPIEGGSYHPVAFLSAQEMGDALALADVVVSRSGAGSIAEIAACRKALILVPLPSAANDEQRKNAYSIAEIGGALVLEESNLGEHLLMEKILTLLDNEGLRVDMGEHLSAFYHADAAEKLADGLIDMMPDYRSV